MRIDKFLAERYGSRNKAAKAIENKLVLVNGKAVSASYEVKSDDKIEFFEAVESYVSAGGYKLSKALKDFGFDVNAKFLPTWVQARAGLPTVCCKTVQKRSIV